MHEASLIENILILAEENLMPYSVKQINSLTLCIGIFSGVMEDALHFAFDVASVSGKFYGAKLLINKLPAKMCCISCGNVTEIQQLPFNCPFCNSKQAELISGREMFLQSIDFEVEE